MPVIMTNTQLWCEGLKRCGIVSESMACHAFPVLSPMHIGIPLPWAEYAGVWPYCLSEAELRSLVGNPMHMAVVGAVEAFALAGIQRIRITFGFL